MKTQDWLILSAYIDHQLSAREKADLEQRLEKNTDLQQALLELQQTKNLLRQLPTKRVPHNFTLTPEMAGIRPRTQRRLFPILSFSSALATVLLVFTFVFGMLPGAAPLAMRSQEMTADSVAIPMEMPAEDEEAPMIIQWGAPEGEQVDGKGGGGAPPAAMGGEPMENLAEAEKAEGEIIEESMEEPAAAAPEMDTFEAEEAPALEAMPMEESAPEPEATRGEELDAQADEEDGIILGIPPADEAGKMIVPTEIIEEEVPAAEPRINDLMIIQIILGVIAAASGIAAFIVRRKNP